MMRLENSYLAGPLVSPLLEIHRQETEAGSSDSETLLQQQQRAQQQQDEEVSLPISSPSSETSELSSVDGNLTCALSGPRPEFEQQVFSSAASHVLNSIPNPSPNSSATIPKDTGKTVENMTSTCDFCLADRNLVQQPLDECVGERISTATKLPATCSDDCQQNLEQLWDPKASFLKEVTSLQCVEKPELVRHLDGRPAASSLRQDSIIPAQLEPLRNEALKPLNDVQLRLEVLQRKLREQREAAERECAELQAALRQEKLQPLPGCLEEKFIVPDVAGMKTPDQELRELEAKLKIDLNVYLTPLVRRQRNKHALRYVPEAELIESFSSLSSEGHCCCGSCKMCQTHTSAQAPLGMTPYGGLLHKDTNCVINQFTNGQINAIPTGPDDEKPKYDRKNLYLQLHRSHNHSNGNQNKLKASSARKNIYWSDQNNGMAKEIDYGHQNLWQTDDISDKKTSSSSEGSLQSLGFSNKTYSPVFTASKFLPGCSSPAVEKFPCLNNSSPLPKAEEFSSVDVADTGSAGEYVRVRQKKGFVPKLYTCNCSNCLELEALECCKWLRAAGFPQYVQMYEGMEFPVDVEGARRDHSFLSEGELNAFTKRIVTLNKCARVRFDHSTVKKDDDSDDEEQQCALSSNWHFERNSRRWSRVGAEPESRMLDVAAPPFKRSGSERIKDRAKELLRRVESMNTRRKKRPARDGKLRMRVGAPIISDPAAMESRVADLACVDLPRQDAGDDVASSLRDAHVAPRHRSLSRHAHSQGEDSSSLTSDQSQNSTPLFRSRRRKKFLPSHDETSGHGNLSDVSGKSGGHDGSSRSGESGTAFSDSECSLPTNRSSDARLTQDQNKLRAQLSAEGALESRQEHLPLQHSSSINVPFGLANPPPTKQQMLINNRNKSLSCSPLPPASSGDEERHSIYDNVPIIICNKSYHEYQPDVTMHSGLKSAREGSGSSEGFPADSRDSLSPADHELAFVVSAAQHLDVLQPKRRNTVDRWHSFNSGSRRSTYSCDKGMPISHFSAGQLLILKKRALLRLTALMEHHCPSRPSWNWELPKFMLKRLRPSDAKTSPAVFGVSLHVTQRKTGYPLPPVIMEALSYLHKSCSDQVGLFRKPGVRSRIQKLRELIDQGETVDFTTYGAYDVADMVKTYFRELPEVLLTNKISELFLAIFHYLPEADRLEAVQCGLLMMPDENREALMTLLTFLAKIADNSSLNQMTASNLAVCLAPSLFHLCIGGVGASPLRRKNTSGTPEQKDLNDNKAAHVCLQAMIQQVSEIDFVRAETLSKISFTYLENSQPLHVEDLGLSSTYPSHHTTTEDRQETGEKTAVTQHSSDWAAYMDSCIAALVKEVKEKNRGYVSIMSPDPDVEVIYRKVGDGHPLRLWKVTTEVEAPPAELLTRVLRERHVWDDSLVRWRVIARLDHQSDVLQFITKSMPPKPHNDFCVLRCWRSDMGRVGGACALVETSVEHPDARLVDGCTRGVVLVSRYFIQPCGSGKSRVTHVSRIDLRGRSPEWYNKSYGALAARKIARLRDSFKHFAEGPESKV